MRPVRRIIHWLMTLFTPHRKNLLSISIRYYCQIPISACIKHLLLGVLLGFISFVFSRHFHLSLHGIRVSHFSTAISPSILRNTINDVNLLLIGVMTAQRFLDTRALEIWRTWGRQVPGRVIFFVADGTVLNMHIQAAEMPIVVLRGVDDSYPPQKKSFAMLRWMFDNQLNNFYWFMRADDDLYIRNEELMKFLISLDPSKAHFLGQAGLGNSFEYGQLSLGAEDNYCMGGPGVLFSRETLRQVGPKLENCLTNLLTTHEDVELGRCVRLHVGIACTWNYEMQRFFHNNATAGQLFTPANESDNGLSVMAALHSLRNLITLHPVKRPEAMRRVHFHAEKLRLAEKRLWRMVLVGKVEELKARKKWLDEKDSGFGDEVDEGARFSGLLLMNGTTAVGLNSTPADSIPHWQFISADAKLLFCAHHTNCPRHALGANWRRALSAIIIELFDHFNNDARQMGRTLHFQTIQYGYLRVRPRYGIDMVLDLALWYRRFRSPHRSNLAVRRHIYIKQRFGPIQTRIFSEQDNNKEPIHILLALKGRASTFARFARNLIELMSVEGEGPETLKLVLVLYSSSPEEDNSIEATLATLVSHISVRLVRMPMLASFSRGQALSLAASLLSARSLLFFADVDVLISAASLHRIRLNTLLGKQAYFPVVFSEFSPQTVHRHSSSWNPPKRQEDNNHFVYNQRRGYFRHFGYGIVSIFRTDFDAIGHFNLTIKGWGMEDVDLFERVVKFRMLRPFRAPDPGLVHVFHPIDCANANESTAQRTACEGTWAQNLASIDFLAEQFGPYL